MPVSRRDEAGMLPADVADQTIGRSLMRLPLAVLVASLTTGYVFGGSIHNLERLRLRWWGLAPLGLAMQMVPLPWSGDAARGVALGLLIASYPVLLVFALRNLRLAGFPLIVIGLLMNLAVISANSGMPVSCEAAIQSDQQGLCAQLRREPGLKHHLAGPEDVLMTLADVVALGTPIRQVVSIGDIVAYLGIFWLLVASMCGKPVFVPKRMPIG